MDELVKARERRRKRRRRVKRKTSVQWGRLVIVGILALAVLFGIFWGLYSGVSYVYNRITEPSVAVTTTSEQRNKENVKVEQKALDKPIYILIVGKDSNQPSQADALFLMSLNMSQHTMDIIGIPSNSKIDSRNKQSVAMLNQIYAQNGIELTKAVVEDIFHISIPYYVIVDEAAFKKTNDVIGEQALYVEKNMEHIDATTGTKDIDLHRGYQNLDSDKALGYLRYTDDKQDNFSRVERQERFLKSWIEREQDTFIITKIWHVWRVWSHYESNISTWDAIQLMRSIGDMDKSQIHFYILPGEKEEIDNTVYWQINPTEAQRLVGIMMGDVLPQDMSQFSTSTSSIQKDVPAESEQNRKVQPSEPGSEPEKSN